MNANIDNLWDLYKDNKWEIEFFRLATGYKWFGITILNIELWFDWE